MDLAEVVVDAVVERSEHFLDLLDGVLVREVLDKRDQNPEDVNVLKILPQMIV